MVGFVPLIALGFGGQGRQPIVLQVNASDAPRNLLHVVELIPVSPGPLLLRYPKWIPGEHQPSGPLKNVVELHVLANGKDIPWRRDGTEMFDIHVNVPDGVRQVQVVFVDAEQPGDTCTNKLARIKWNRLLFLPKGPAKDIQIQASVKAPDGWHAYNALPMTQSGDTYQLPVTDAERLIDSPALLGQYGKVVTLAPGHEMDMVADEPADLELSDSQLEGMKNVVTEAHLLWGAQHFRTYHWLISLSNFGAFAGLEHNECSEDGMGAQSFTGGGGNQFGDVLSHEFTHSWNGKYRRPADLYQLDYATPQGGSLLWVYEGMTQYWGNVLPTRAGLWTFDQLHDTFARNAASMAYKSGRTWRSTEDTAASASILRNAGQTWGNARRAQDYYTEGTLIWVGVDATIRKITDGKKSLDDFCKLFYGGKDTGPMVVPYTYQDVLKALNTVAPYDWNSYFQQMVYAVHPGPTTEGLEMAGWKLVFTSEPIAARGGGGSRGRAAPGANHAYDIGLSLDADGTITDMLMGSPSDEAGLTPSMKLITVNDRVYSDEALTAAIADAQKTKQPIVLQALKDGAISTIHLPYYDGPKYPHLERIEGTTDYLGLIAKQRRP